MAKVAVVGLSLAGDPRAITAALLENMPDAEVPVTAVFGHRSVTAFAAVLGVLARGHGYVPLNPAFPPARNRVMLERAGCEAVIVDSRAMPGLDREAEPTGVTHANVRAFLDSVRDRYDFLPTDMIRRSGVEDDGLPSRPALRPTFARWVRVVSILLLRPSIIAPYSDWAGAARPKAAMNDYGR